LSIFRIGNTRAYTQFDLPTPSKIGRQLYIIKPARPGVKARLLLDLGQGCIGSPSASLDGKTIYASLARKGESFYHIYKIPTDGGKPTRMTNGPFHDLDPAELPDGRIVFSSTRIGTFEEYHSSPSRALFVMNGDGSGINPITFTSIFDNEPKVMADGSIVFIRSDNFMERAKVETRLHAIRPDGTGGRSIASADRGARYGARLRKFGFGSPAPLPDGRLAFLSSRGNLLIKPGAPKERAHRLPSNLCGVAPLPDGRLLCTVNRKAQAASNPSVEFVLELAETRTQIERVVIENYGQAEAKGNYYAKDFSIAASSSSRDPKAFKKICKGTLKAKLGPQTFKIQPTEAKYIKLLITSGYRQDYIELGELGIYDSKGRNVAAAANGGKVLSCTSAYKAPGVWAPEYLIDGKPSGRGGSWCSEKFSSRKGGGHYNTIAILDPDRANQLTTLFQSTGGAIHSAVYAGRRGGQKKAIANTLKIRKATPGVATGYFLCQKAQITRKTAADWPRIRSVRVLGGKVSTLRSSNFEAVHAGLEVIELGSVALAPDGSFFVEVPADTPIAFQMLDGEGRPQLNEMSWIFVRPGETRSCIGCHEPRGVAPPSVDRRIQAAKARPAKLVGRGKPYRFRGQNPWVNGLMDMQFERIREIASVGQRGFDKDPGATGAVEWKTVESWLMSKDAGLRISACQRLGGTRGRRFSGSLVRLLKDSDREVRIAAAMALSACGNRASIPHLLAALDDPDPVVAQAADMALENLTAHTGKFNPFVSAEQRHRQADTRRTWFKSLSWGAHEKALIARLKETDRVLKHKAVVALGHIGGDNAKKALRQFLIKESKTNPYKQRGPGEGITFAADSRLNPRIIQEAARALGYLRDADAIGVLKDILGRNLSSRKSNLFLAEACLEALSVIGDKQLEDYMIKTFGQLEEFHEYYNWYGGGHPYNEVSTLHFRILDVLDRIGSAKTATLTGAIIRSLPIDVDRQLLFELDDYELMAGRLVKRSGCEDKVVETCLGLLGDAAAIADDTIKPSVSKLYRAFAGRPQLENRAAQVLSILCADRKYEPRIRAVFNRYRGRKRDRLFRTRTIRSPVPDRPWVLFYMARLLGKLADPGSSDCLIAALEKDPNEAAFGRPAPDTVWVGMLQEDNTPCYRAAAAYALGRIGKRSAADVLMKVLGNMDNALDVRHASAMALRCIADDRKVRAIARLAADYPDVSVKQVLLSMSRRDD
jgi:HEAT repeat protein